MNLNRGDAMAAEVRAQDEAKKAAAARRRQATRRLAAVAESQRQLEEQRAGREAQLASLDAERNSEGLLARMREYEDQVGCGAAKTRASC